MYPIINKDEYKGYLFNITGDLAIVYEGPYASAKSPHPITAEVFQRLNEYKIGKRLASIHVICPFQHEEGKENYTLRQLRKGWHRVELELQLISPNVKRVLLVSNSTLLTKVVFPGMKPLDDTHGSILTLDSGLEVVPTWWKHWEYREPWKDNDIDRWKNLVKGDPLPYETNLDNIYGNHIIIDLETTGLHSWKDTITVLGVQWDDNKRAIITENISHNIDILTKLVKRGAHVTFHNAQFDLGFMGQPFRDACIAKNAAHCTMIRARARGELANTLKHLGNLYTDRPGNYAWCKPGEAHSFDNPAYVTEDIEVTWQLSKIFHQEGCLPVVKQFEQAMIMAAEQTLSGSYVDDTLLSTLDMDGKAAVEMYEEMFVQDFGVRPGQTQEVIKILLEQGYELEKKTDKGNYQLNDEVCEELGLYLLLQYRKAKKLDSSYIGKLVGLKRSDGTVSHYQGLMFADTGRSTMKEFNWQQVSGKSPVKNLLTSRYEGGKILVCDLAQAELRVLALISNDHVFAKLFESEDVHKSNAARAHKVTESEVTKDMRYDAKTLIFKIVYGGVATTEGQKIVEKFFRSHFKIAFDWLDATKRKCKEDIFVTDPYGKTRNLLKVKSYRGIGGVGRAGVNSPIQGVASHIAMQVTYNAWWLFRKFGLKSKVLFGVHDSLNADIHPEEVDICIMLVRLAFAMLRESNLYVVFPLAKTLPMLGEMLIGESWGYVDNEANKVEPIQCSSHDTITIDDCMNFHYGKDGWF